MIRSGLEGGQGARDIAVGNFKQKEDSKMRIQMPGYVDFRGYDLGWGDSKSNSSNGLCRFPQAIMENLEAPLIYGENRKEAFRDPGNIDGR